MTTTTGRADMRPRVSSQVLQPLFERKLRRFLEAQLAPHLDAAGDYAAGAVANLQTYGDALRFLDAHASSLALFEAEAASSAMEDLRILPGERLEQVVDGWRWSLRPPSLPWSRMGAPDTDAADLFAPTVMANLIEAGGLQSALTSTPPGVSRDEVIAFIEERSPGRSMGYSDPVTITSADGSSRIGRHGEIVPDVRALGTMLVLPANESDRAYTIDGHQVMWLYASAFSEEERAAARPRRVGWQVMRTLASVASGDAYRLLREVIVPEALRRAQATDLADEERVRDDLAGAVLRHVRDLVADISRIELPLNPVQEWDWTSTARQLDEALALSAEKLGEQGERWAAKIRSDASSRVGEQLWRIWQGEPYLIALASLLWPGTQRTLNTKPFALSGARVGNDNYAKLPKISSPMSWAFGGSAMRETNIDGDTYAPEPAVACKLLPRTCALLSELSPGHERKPHQTVLALEDHCDPLPVAVAGATQYAISPVAAKIAMLALGADDIKRGHLRSFELAKLARLIAPDAKRIRPREIQNCAEALDELRRLFVFLPDGGKIQLFDIKSAQDPASVAGDFEAVIGLTRLFLNTLANVGTLSGPLLRGGEYNGEFLINMSGAMRIPTKRPSLLRHYVRAAAAWNAAFKLGSGAFDPNMLPAHTDEQWGAITNALPLGVVEYLKANSLHRRNPTRRAQWSKARKILRDELDELAGECGLIVVQKVGRDGRFKLLPPPAYEEAWKQARKAGARPEAY